MQLADSIQFLDDVVGHGVTFAVQPILDSECTDQAIGYEMLARFGMDTACPVMPDEMLAIAFQRGRWAEVDEALLAAALAQEPPPGAMFVNLHIESLMRDTVVERLLAYAEGTRDEAPLVVELSERVHVEDWRLVRQRMEVIQAAGARFALDDFGAGYANMDAIFEAPLDIIKIDKRLISFARESERARRIFGNVAAMCRNAGMSVVCEGVEVEGDHRIAMDAGCQYLQGFLFGRPRAWSNDSGEAPRAPVLPLGR